MSVRKSDHELLFGGLRHRLARQAIPVWRALGDNRIWRWLAWQFPQIDQWGEVLTLSWAGSLSATRPVPHG